MAKSDPARRLPDDEIVRQLARAEQALGIAPATNRKFLRFGNWFVEKRCFRRVLLDFILRRPVEIFPHLALQPRRKAWSRLWKSWQPGGAIHCPLAADFICVRNNIRAFYPGAKRPFTLKLPRAHDEVSRRAIEREIAARRRVEAAGHLRVPVLLGEPSSGFLSEEIVAGHTPSPTRDGDLLRGWLESALWPHYLRQGLDFKRIDEVLDLDEVAKICGDLAVADFLRSEKRVIVTIGHGDLSLANLLLTADGAIWVVDWESSREMVLARDLWPLVQELPGAREIFARHIAELAADVPLLDLDGQLLVHLFQSILEWTRHGLPRRTDAQRDAAVQKALGQAREILAKL